MVDNALESAINAAWETKEEICAKTTGPIREAISETLDLLGTGSLRVAEPTGTGNWRVNQWAKKPFS